MPKMMASLGSCYNDYEIFKLDLLAFGSLVKEMAVEFEAYLHGCSCSPY